MAASTIKVSSLLLLTAMLFAATLRPAIAFDIVKILQGNHDFVAFASMLESTKLSDNINSKKGITVLAVSNRDVMDKMMQRGTDMKTAMAKNILRLHVVMDYWPMEKLSSLAERSKYSTTLFETTGNAPGSTGFANVTKDRSKKIVVQNLGGNGSSNGFAYVVKSLYEEPYNLSVLQVDRLLMPAAVKEMKIPNRWELNLTQILTEAGYKEFANQMKTQELEDAFLNSPNGLTLLVPKDSSLQSLYSLNSVGSRKTVVKYHAVPAYMPVHSLKHNTGRLSTFASINSNAGYTTNSNGNAHDYSLNGVSTDDDDNVSIMSSGSSSASITGTLLDDYPFVIHTVDKMLKPKSVYGGDGY